MARSFAVILVLASLLAPSFAESAFSGATPSATAVSAAADQDGGAPAAPSRRDGVVHAGAHCACQLADRLGPVAPAAPVAFSAVVHPATAMRALASFEAEPPARPPRA